MTDAAELVARWEHGDEKHRQWLRDVAIPDIEAAFAKARREAIQEAIMLVNNLPLAPIYDQDDCAPWMAYVESRRDAVRDLRVLLGHGHLTRAPDRIDYEDGDLDDIVLKDVTMFRMERMDDGHFWIRCYRDNEPDVVFNLTAEGNKITGRHEYD